jgi:hypothetical protein
LPHPYASYCKCAVAKQRYLDHLALSKPSNPTQRDKVTAVARQARLVRLELAVSNPVNRVTDARLLEALH